MQKVLLHLKCAYECERATLNLKVVETRNRDLLDRAADKLAIKNRRTQVIKDDKLRAMCA